jgi:YD repeat-containing protein
MRTIVRIIHTWFTFSVRVIGKRGHGALCISLLASAACLPAHAGSVAYKYDTLGRLSTATYNNGAVIAYAYDAAGNRTSHTVTGAPA